MKKVAKVTCSAIVATSLMLAPLSGPASIVFAANQTSAVSKALKPYAGTKLKTFMISDKSYIQVKDIFFQYGSNEKDLFFTISVYNGDNRSINFLDYWIEVHASNGGKFSIQGHPNNSKSNTIAPKTTEEYTFYAKIDPKLNYTDLIFKLIKWDFSQPDYSRTIGQTRVTSAYQNVVHSNQYYILRKGNEQIKTYLNKGTRFTLGDHNQIQTEFNMENVGYFSYTIPKYQFYLKTKKGFIMKLSTDLTENQKIDPGDTFKISLKGSIKKNVDLSGSQIIMTSLDGESQVETPRAIYNLVWQNDGTFITLENKAAALKLDGVNVEASVTNLYSDNNGTQNEIALTLKWNNKGQEAVALPNYKYVIMNSDGTRYPVSAGEETVQLIPGVEREVTLNAVIPSEKMEGLTLLVQEPKEENKTTEFVLAALKLSKTQELTAVTKKVYRTEKGTYEFAVNRVERLPWGNQDIINVFIDIENQGKQSQVIPQVAAALRLNGLTVNEQNVSLIKLDNTVMLDPQQKTSYVLTTKVPYTYNFDEMTLNLSDKVNENSKQTIGLFKMNTISPVPSISISERYKITSLGRRATVEFLNTYLFEGKDKDLIYADLKYTNDENRFNELPVLKAYFKTSEGQYIEAKLENIKTVMKPGDNGIITVTAEVPKTFTHDGTVQLLIGEALSAGSYATPEATVDSFIGATAVRLPKSQNSPLDELAKLELKPYTFTVHKINALLSEMSNLKLEMNYTLDKTAAYNVVESPRKLYVEVTDGRIAYGSTVELEPAEGEGLKVGEELEFTVPITGQQIGNLIFNGYEVKVYEEIEGFKRLLGSKKFGTFQIGVLPN
ncbi:hypothetical protein AB6A23_01905 [Paenibacillus tarimensis]